MKNVIKLGLVFGVVLIFIGCGDGSKNVEEFAEKFNNMPKDKLESINNDCEKNKKEIKEELSENAILLFYFGNIYNKTISELEKLGFTKRFIECIIVEKTIKAKE